jgi:hypothetical protein
VHRARPPTRRVLANPQVVRRERKQPEMVVIAAMAPRRAWPRIPLAVLARLSHSTCGFRHLFSRQFGPQLANSSSTDPQKGASSGTPRCTAEGRSGYITWVGTPTPF